jgi:hypothetical protein
VPLDALAHDDLRRHCSAPSSVEAFSNSEDWVMAPITSSGVG